MSDTEKIIQGFGLAILFFSIVGGLFYYLVYCDNIFKKLHFAIKVKSHVKNMIKELDECSHK